MTRPQRKQLRFQADFACNNPDRTTDHRMCGYEIHVESFVAVVKSSGHEIACNHCGARYLVKEDGATRISELEIVRRHDFRDAVGNEYSPNLTVSGDKLGIPVFGERNSND